MAIINKNNNKEFSEGHKKQVWKSFFILFIPFTVINILAFILVNILFINVEQVQLQSRVQAAIEVGSRLAQRDFDSVISQLEFLSKSESMKAFIAADNADTRDHLKLEFFNLAETAHLYDQIRLLGPTGMELVRIDYKNGEPVVIPAEQLQDKSNRYYFKQSASINNDKLYISPLDLNIEQGKVEMPRKPMIRFAKPLRNQAGELKGVVVLNYFGRLFLDTFRQQMAVAPGEAALLNNEGFWLSSEDASREWGFILDHQQSFSALYPEVWRQIKLMEQGIIKWNNGRFSFASVHPVVDVHEKVANKDHFLDQWKIVIVNTVWGYTPAFLFTKVKFLYPILVIYPLGLILIYIWARASTGRKAAELQLKELNHVLERRVEERSRELEVTKSVTILSMATLAETRDNETGLHLRRTQNYVRLLAAELCKHPDFAEFLSSETIELLYKSAPLHDIGKVGIPDDILLKPGKLSNSEFEIMQRHTVYGSKAIESSILTLTSELQQSNGPTFLQFAQDIAHYHHEKWDGSGYPEGLVADQIPVVARIMAVADVFDALSCRRIYKKAFGRQETERIILAGRGSHFDPRIIDAFMHVRESFWQVNSQFSEVPESVFPVQKLSAERTTQCAGSAA
ncbi:HD domain-containing phosphohydrolase [Psychromonas ossibalaenae]|uniref:HD domain-containing phosphohydrolase n=1 Tax=Psychromonas ossibalaenae TaxID=444922 RepID=UPI0003739733|nr:HD domain-containing phosphohydrolase [Psychromonas ossibalaenae]